MEQANPNTAARVASRWIQRAKHSTEQTLVPARRFVEKHELRIVVVLVAAVVTLSGTGVSIVSSFWSIVSAIGTLTTSVFNLAVLLGIGLGLVAAAGGVRTRNAFARIRSYLMEERTAIGGDRN